MLRRLDEVVETDPAARARARLRAVGRAYVEFALAEPGLFNVAFCKREPGAPDSMEDAAAYALLGRVLDELVSAGTLSAEGRLGADVACWAAVHGLSVLLLDGPLHDLPPEGREGAIAKVIATVERGLTGVVSRGALRWLRRARASLVEEVALATVSKPRKRNITIGSRCSIPL